MVSAKDFYITCECTVLVNKMIGPFNQDLAPEMLLE